MEASKLPMQHKYLQKYIPQPAFATILERLLAAEQYEDSQDEQCNTEVCVALVVLKECQKLIWGKGSLSLSLNVLLGTLFMLENKDLFTFCLFCKCQESYEEDRT